MALGEAFGHCPGLGLIPPDPGCAAEVWARVLRRLEAIGAAVESERAREAYFATGGLRLLHGGDFLDSLAHVPVGALLVTYGEATARSGNFTSHLWGVHRVLEDGSTELLDGGRSQDRGWTVKACDVIE